MADPLEQFPMPTIADVLCNACQLLDSVKMEWVKEGCWSTWDQAVRDGLSRELQKTYADTDAGRGMMTAEQLQAMKIEQEREAAERIRRENAVTLLAEKEREIAQLRIDYQQELFHTEARAEAAEQRLQDAQAEVRKFMDVANNNARERNEAVDRETALVERLRQREAELEQLREQKIIDADFGVQP